MSKKTIVTFIKPWRGYGPDEVAGFDKKEADLLIEKGVAQLHSGKKAAAKKEQNPAAGSNPTPPSANALDTDPGAGAGDDSDNADAKP